MKIKSCIAMPILVLYQHWNFFSNIHILQKVHALFYHFTPNLVRKVKLASCIFLEAGKPKTEVSQYSDGFITLIIKLMG